MQAPPSVQTSSSTKSVTVTVTPDLHFGTFEMVSSKIVVHARLNNTLDTRMILDCGSSSSVLSSQAVKALNLSLQPVERHGRRFAVGELASLKVGSATLEKVPFAVLDDSDFIRKFNKDNPESTVAGLIGLDTLEKSAVGLDFATHTYALWVGGKIRQEEATSFNCIVCTPASDTMHLLWPGASQAIGQETVKNPAMKDLSPQVFPLDRAEKEPGYHTVVKIDDVPFSLYIDTGGAFIILTDSQARRLNPIMSSEMKVGFPLMKEMLKSTQVFARRFQMGSLQRRFPIICVAHRSTEAPTDALLAINDTMFADCRVILDFPGHTFYLSPYDAQEDGVLSSLAQRGLFCKMQVTDKLILMIGKGSPAEKAGLKDNDALLGWGGKTLEQMTDLPDLGASLLNATPLTVTVRRKGQSKPLTVTLPSGPWMP
jgi:hypothetical protein